MQPQIIIPPPLQPGDLLHVIAPSGTLRELEPFHRGIKIWRSHNYQIEIIPEIDDRWGYLAGTDKNRRHHLKTAWSDPECKGILCARGGFGSTRILEDWNWEDTPPKWLIGFSDITALLWSLYNVGISGVHGAVLTTLAAEPEWSQQRLFDWVEGCAIEPIHGTGWGGGVATGILLPANLTVATHLLGTPYQPNLERVILAIEDVGEAPYRIDRMLTQWRMSGILKKVCGIAVGRFSQCQPPANIPSFTIEEVLRDRLSDLGIPVVSELPFGHDGCNAALPVGVMATLDGDKGSLTINATSATE
jgi:muramoyltetrapeptide carboxypeptidase